MDNAVMNAIMLIEELTSKSGQPLDKFMASAKVIAAHEAELAAKRQITDNEREAIRKVIEADGFSEDVSPTDVCVAANVRLIQGTKSFANYQIKQLLLEHKKANSSN